MADRPTPASTDSPGAAHVLARAVRAILLEHKGKVLSDEL